MVYPFSSVQSVISGSIKFFCLMDACLVQVLGRDAAVRAGLGREKDRALCAADMPVNGSGLDRLLRAEDIDLILRKDIFVVRRSTKARLLPEGLASF